jgi:hypothetical protein
VSKLKFQPGDMVKLKSFKAQPWMNVHYLRHMNNIMGSTFCVLSHEWGGDYRCICVSGPCTSITWVNSYTFGKVKLPLLQQMAIDISN